MGSLDITTLAILQAVTSLHVLLAPKVPAGDEDPRAAAFAAELRVLGRELADMPVTAMRKNMKVFERKFRMQQREIMEEMKKVVVHEGDRVISSVLAGPHERIIDPV